MDAFMLGMGMLGKCEIAMQLLKEQASAYFCLPQYERLKAQKPANSRVQV